MTDEDVIGLLERLGTIYKTEAVGDPAKTIDSWSWVLGDLDADAVFAAARTWCRTEAYPPRPGDLRRLIGADRADKQLDGALYRRFGALRGVLQDDGWLQPDQRDEFNRIERRLGLIPSAVPTSPPFGFKPREYMIGHRPTTPEEWRQESELVDAKIEEAVTA